jgi:UDP-glucose 4-epimerase
MVLITGGSGYLGGRISSYLEQLGYSVRVGKSISSNSDGFPIDISDDESIDRACDGISHIIHLAAMNKQSCDDNPERALMVNGLGTLKLLNAAKRNKISKFLYFSTIHVYGLHLIDEVNEDSLTRPVNSYSITHRLSEDYVTEFYHKYNLSSSIFRLSNAIGSPVDSTINCWMLVSNDFCKQAVINKSINVHSNKFVQMDFIPISSICSVVEKSLVSNKLNGEIVNLSSGVVTTLEGLAMLIASRTKKVLGFSPSIHFANNSDNNKLTKFTISNKKITDLNFKIEKNIVGEIDALLLNCSKWF